MVTVKDFMQMKVKDVQNMKIKDFKEKKSAVAETTTEKN